MGNKHTKPIATFSEWQKVQSQNDIEIYRNKKNNQLAEKRSVTIDPHYDLEDQLKIYHMRQNNNDALVRAFGAEEVHKKAHGEGICSGHKKLEVLTEKMHYRLSQFPQLTFPESLLFLRESLRAYYRVFKSYGPIHVTKKMIGINQFGEVKSWVNQNWALNHPNNDLPTLQSTKLQSFSNRSTKNGSGSEVSNAKYRDETEMVYNIVAVIEEKCEQGKFPKAFSEQVEQHSSSFRKLSTYLQDFIRVNELFIPPKINFETVFVSKYQTRLIQQHQQAGQQISGQSEEVQNQRILTTTVGGQSLGYNTAIVGGGYQQNVSNVQGLGYGTNVIQGQEANQGGYTVTKTTTTTYGNNINQGITTTNPITFTSSYQPSTYQASSYQHQAPSSSILTSNTNLPASIPWQKSQSIYKLPQQPSQNTYSSSYYQYSTTNPSSVGVGSYKLGGPSTGEYMAESYKPLSYNSALGNSSRLQVNGATQANGAQNFLNSGNQNVYTFTSLDNRFGTSQSDNPLSPYQNLAQFTNDHKTQFQAYTSTTPTKQSYEQFKKKFGQFGQGTTTNPTTYNYSTTTYETKHTYEPFVSDSAQKGSSFSFDGRSNLTTKFNEYAGVKGYSNALTSYEKANTNLTGANTDGAALEGKYASEFNNLLGPMLDLKNQYQSQKNEQYGAVNQGITYLNEGFTIRESSTAQHA